MMSLCYTVGPLNNETFRTPKLFHYIEIFLNLASLAQYKTIWDNSQLLMSEHSRIKIQTDERVKVVSTLHV